MIGLLLLIIVVFVVWQLNAPGQQFLPRFARLLAKPAILQGPASFISGRSSANGRFRDRDVAIHLHLKRSRYGQGRLVVAVRTRKQPPLTDSSIDARISDDAGRRALLSLATHGLLLSLEEDRLNALWKPQGFFIFPGRFSEAKWSEVLDALHTVATSLEATP